MSAINAIDDVLNGVICHAVYASQVISARYHAMPPVLPLPDTTFRLFVTVMLYYGNLMMWFHVQ